MGRKLNLLAVAGTMLVSQPALAATQTFSLSVDGSSTGIGAGPYGTVTVTENAGGTLTFTQTLLAGYRIHDGNANHNAFAFSIIGDPAVTVSALTAGFAPIFQSAGTNVSAPPFQDFYTAIDCTGCESGYEGGFAGPLTFTVSSAGGLSLASLRSTTYSGNQIFFSTDLVNVAGQTGNIGATRNSGAVPEPATWAMMLVGFGAMGVSMRRRRPVALQQTA